MKPTRRALRITLIAVAAVVVVLFGTGAILLWQFNPDSFKPQIEAAVKRATGRELALNGKIGLKFSLTPTIEVRDAAFSNPPGFSRPQMATLQSMELRLALLPLLSRQIQIDTLVLNNPNILLETNGAGQPNWRLTPEVSPTAPPGSQTPPAGPARTKTEISVASIRIQDGVLAYRDDRTGKVTTLGLPDFTSTAASATAPTHISVDASYNGHDFNLIGDIGSLTRLQDPAATTPWPVNLVLTAAGARLTADGALTKPLEGKGYTLSVTGSVPDATRLAPYLQGFVLPPLHDVSFAAKIADKNATLPDITSLTLHVGASDLGAQMPGVMLDKLDIAAPAVDQPVKASAAGSLRGLPLAVTGTFGAPKALLPGAGATPFPIDVSLQAAGATASAKGAVADARTLTGVNLALAAKIPDLATLAPLAHSPLPSIKTIAFQGTLTDTNGGLRTGAALHGMALTSADGDLSGDATVGLGARASLAAVLKSTRIDADAIQAAIDQMPQPAKPAPGGKPAEPPAAKPEPRPHDERLFSDRPIPFGLLRAADADLTLNVADLRSGGVDYKAITAHALLKNGALSVDPLAAELPAGRLQATFIADATKPAPLVHLTVRAPGLALTTILAMVHEPSYASGNLEVYADLSGTGGSPHALAASLDGSLGLAMAGGTIDNRLLGSVLGKVMDSLNALDLVGKGGTSDLRCFAARMDAHNGTSRIDPLVLSSSLLTMTGAGTANLGAETLALQLRPQARVAGTGLVIPINVTGPIRDPAVRVNKLGTAESNAGSVAGAVIGDATPLGVLGGLLGADKLIAGSGDICTPALAMARGQPVPKVASQPSKPAGPSLSNPAATLRNLFR